MSLLHSGNEDVCLPLVTEPTGATCVCSIVLCQVVALSYQVRTAGRQQSIVEYMLHYYHACQWGQCPRSVFPAQWAAGPQDNVGCVLETSL